MHSRSLQNHLQDSKATMASTTRLVAVSILSCLALSVYGFIAPTSTTIRSNDRNLGKLPPLRSHLSSLLASPDPIQVHDNNKVPEQTGSVSILQPTRSFLLSLALVTTLTLSTPLATGTTAAYAYDNNDYASDTVQTAIQTLRDAAGNADRTFDAYENIAEIIVEGKGVGGSVDYKGVTLNRGSIADEDTSIYNPGLTLLTEGEKERLVESLMQSRQASIDQNQWNDKNQAAYSYLKFQLDPLHMTELKGYLRVAPFLVGVLYLGVLAVQQFARDLFPVAYIAAVLLLVAPAAILVLTAS